MQVIGGVSGEIPNYTPTAAENTALDQIMKNAQAGNPFSGQITSLANDLFTGGQDRTGVVNDAYANYQKQAQPYLDPGYLDPAKNPHFNSYTTQLGDDAASRVNSMFAGTGRDFSGANMQALGIQIFRKGYLEYGRREPTRYLIEQHKAITETVRTAPHVQAVMTRVSFSGLANNGGADLPIRTDTSRRPRRRR